MKKAKKTALDRRLEQLEKERLHLERQMKQLDRTVGRGGVAPSGLPAGGGAGREKMRRGRASVEGTREGGVPSAGDANDLFAWSSRRNAARPAEGGGGAMGRPASVLQAQPVRVDRRFMNYFTSGSFSPAVVTRQDRRQQRNKAIFMVIVVLFAALVIARMLFF